MNTSMFSPSGFPFTFSEMVADAAMELPEFTKKGDSTFLRESTYLLMVAFWNNYLLLLPEEARDAYEKAVENGSSEDFLTWHKTYANFKEDPAAEERGRNVLQDLATRLPEALKKDYEDYHNKHRS
jgi:hypothetical protein